MWIRELFSRKKKKQAPSNGTKPSEKEHLTERASKNSDELKQKEAATGKRFSDKFNKMREERMEAVRSAVGKLSEAVDRNGDTRECVSSSIHMLNLNGVKTLYGGDWKEALRLRGKYKELIVGFLDGRPDASKCEIAKELELDIKIIDDITSDEDMVGRLQVQQGT